MASPKGKLVRLFGSLLLSHATVVAAEEVGPGFRKLTLQGDSPKPNPGDKLQVLLPSDDVRTYSPVAWHDGTVVLLGWTHAGGPGAQWLAKVEVGADVGFARAQRSLSLPGGPVILVGDETSVAVAASFERAQPKQVHAVLQGESPEAVRRAAQSIGLHPVHVAPRGDTAGVVTAVVAARAAAPNATIALTGGSDLVVAVRAALREQGIRDVKTKTYWIPGKTGLD
jgi:NADPH-dependent ferric siderophore reductase